MSYRWTEVEDDFLIKNYLDFTHQELSEKLGRTFEAVEGRCFRLKLFKIKRVELGKKYNRLTVLKEAEKRKNGVRYYLCKCDCGTLKEIKAYHLRCGRIRSCGCLNRDKYIRRRLDNGEGSIRKWKHSYKDGARKRGLAWELTDEMFKELVFKNCYYCNAEPRNYNPYLKANGSLIKKTTPMDWVQLNWIKVNGIDRKDNSQGYIIENCLPCCTFCNLAKGDCSYEEFMNHLNRLVSFRKSI